MRRVLVVGMSGSGKTTLARAIGDRLGLPVHELDALAFGPGWSDAPDFAEVVAGIVAEPEWVFDSWGYTGVRRPMWSAAETVVWLDYGHRVVMPRILRRSLRRTIRREVIFGGNRETLSGWLSGDHPAWHALTHLRTRRARIEALIGEYAPPEVIRLTDPEQARAWLRGLS